MLTHVFLAWTLLVQVQLHLCQEGVCAPHPRVPQRSQAVRTLATESECLAAQMDLQRAYQRLQSRVVPPLPDRRQVALQRTFVCHPSN
jgi:hypothetical protein